jgi:outer membrane protein assembly factor BamA
LCLSPFIKGQAVPKLLITSIEVQGNRHSKERVVFRELDIQQGDSLSVSEIEIAIERNRKRILDTGMFNEVDIRTIYSNPKKIKLVIVVIENWYIYPSPIAELADRNFNVWWGEQQRSLKRINLGIRAEHINLTGHRDKLMMTLHGGYTNKYEIAYNFPFLNQSNTLGAGAFIFYANNKEIAYVTENNKSLFASNDDEIMLQRFRTGVHVSWRQNVLTNHVFRIEYHQNQISDFVARELNPDYFLDNNTRMSFVHLSYNLDYDYRHFKLYPDKGHRIQFNIKRYGLFASDDFSNFALGLELEKYINPLKRIIIASKVKFKTNLNRDIQAFANNTALGYGKDYLRGYELYVIDGTDYFYSKNSIRFKGFDRSFDLANSMPLAQFKRINLQVYLSANIDISYVYEPNYIISNTLNNRFLYGGGPAVDLIVFNNYLFRIEYNFNHKGEKGLFLQNSVSF